LLLLMPFLAQFQLNVCENRLPLSRAAARKNTDLFMGTFV